MKTEDEYAFIAAMIYGDILFQPVKFEPGHRIPKKVEEVIP
jgi:hypothetical protein